MKKCKEQDSGATALYLASKLGHEDVVQVLLAKENLDINHVEKKYGETALYIGSEHGHSQVVQLLLQHVDIDVNHVAQDGWTALMIAAQNGHKEIVSLLCWREDLDTKIVDTDGYSALDIAERASKRNKKIADMIRNYSATSTKKSISKAANKVFRRCNSTRF